MRRYGYLKSGLSQQFQNPFDLDPMRNWRRFWGLGGVVEAPQPNDPLTGKSWTRVQLPTAAQLFPVYGRINVSTKYPDTVTVCTSQTVAAGPSTPWSHQQGEGRGGEDDWLDSHSPALPPAVATPKGATPGKGSGGAGQQRSDGGGVDPLADSASMADSQLTAPFAGGSAVELWFVRDIERMPAVLREVHDGCHAGWQGAGFASASGRFDGHVGREVDADAL